MSQINKTRMELILKQRKSSLSLHSFKKAKNLIRGCQMDGKPCKKITIICACTLFEANVKLSIEIHNA